MTYTIPQAGGSLRLHLNENTAGCSPAVLEALRTITPQETAFYPDYGGITTATEHWLGVGPGWVQLTNGLDEGLHVCAFAAARGRLGAEALIVEPAFEMYAACADAAGLVTTRVQSPDDLSFPLDDVLRAISVRTRLINLTDPGNPSGLGIPLEAIEAIAAAARGAIVLVDEAYAEFSGRTLGAAFLDHHRNVVVGRTFAKAHGLAALRVGALIAHPDTLAQVRRLLPPFSLNICAVRALAAALIDRPYLEWYVGQSRQSKELLYAFCDAHGLHYWRSETNFVLIRIGDNAPDVVRAMADRGVSIRDRSSTPGCRGCVRVTAGVVEHTRVAVAALEAALATRAN